MVLISEGVLVKWYYNRLWRLLRFVGTFMGWVKSSVQIGRLG